VVVGWFFWKQSTKDNSEQKSSETAQSQTSSTNTEQTPPVAADNGKCERTFNNSDLNKVTVNSTDKFVTLSVKGFGDIKIEVNKTDAPKTSANFLKLAKAGFYDCLTFHRVAKGFVIQGGDPSGDGTGGPGYTVPAEIKLKHTKYSIAMARQGDAVNPNRESSGSQFYISLEALPMLDGQYTVFGQVVAGMDVVDKIGAVPIDGAGDGPPTEKVEITKAVVSDK
jgi:cyclophilin family peptidyl-prolyl cis-trans isomerase